MKIALILTNKHNQKLINILENQKIYGGFKKTSIDLLVLQYVS